MVSTGKNVGGSQVETRTRNQKASKEPRNHTLFWPLIFASLCRMTFLASLSTQRLTI